jgi:ABC-type amino acid transport system permease subunit
LVQKLFLIILKTQKTYQIEQRKPEKVLKCILLLFIPLPWLTIVISGSSSQNTLDTIQVAFPCLGIIYLEDTKRLDLAVALAAPGTKRQSYPLDDFFPDVP